MPQQFPAIHEIGRTVLFIKNNKIIGRGHSQVSRGNQFVGVRVESGEIFDQLQHVEPFKSIGVREVYPHFAPISGSFLSLLQQEDHLQEAIAILDGCFVVEREAFNLGNVPDHFKTVKGYKSVAEQLDK